MKKPRKIRKTSSIKIEALAVLGKESFSIKVSELKIASEEKRRE
jgi:hypothetical protein